MIFCKYDIIFVNLEHLKPRSPQPKSFEIVSTICTCVLFNY
jgi:hypothetical protein